MNGNQAIETALRALEHPDAGVLDASALGGVRQRLGDGERALFDRAVEIKRGFDDLHLRVMRSAAFAEASLGTAAFIHELRSCLAPLVGLADLLKETPNSPYLGEWLGEISSLARKVADLLDRHTALLRTESSEEEPCELQGVINEAKQYFARLPPGVQLAVEVPADVPRAMARRRQLLHALINLLANARDAHKGRPGAIRIVGRAADGLVELLVTDEGSGVDPGIRSRLFEPLFTTKQENGTGLGLFLSRELLRPHGELVLLDDAATPQGARTAFAIRLPREGSARVTASQVVEPHTAPVPGDPWSASKQKAHDKVAPLVAEERNNPVLLVEDEAPVRRMTRAVLDSVANIKIYEAADAAFAFKLLEKLQVDFLVCDKNLPDQDGLEVIRKAREQHPNVDAMIVTGYPSPESAAEAIRVGATDYLLKPVREVKVLRESVSSALSRQKLHRLAARHESTWREVFRELLAGAPEPSRPIFERARAQFDNRVAPSPRCAVAVQEELQDWIAAAGVDVVRVKGAAELGAIDGDVDLVVFPAEISSELARELLAASRARPHPPHLVGVGRYVQTETAVAAIQGRTGVLIDRGVASEQLLERLRWATERRRRETRAEALRAVLKELGFAF